MKEKELATFVQGKSMSWDEGKLTLWIPFNELAAFTQMVGEVYISDGGEDVNLQYDCVGIELNDICFNFNIDPTCILPIRDN